MYNPQYQGLYYFDTFTFTSLGTSGHRGPVSAKAYANAPWREGDFSIQDGQQYWTVPANGTYEITAAGAYGSFPGRVVTGQVKLGEGQQLRLLVGQRPSSTYAGGATWVSTGSTLLMVASGGDGTGGANASFSPYGTGKGQNGAGYLTEGLSTNVTYPFLKPNAYVNGGYGNRLPDNTIEAGFGGGNLVGGGGYTGSPGDGVSGATCYAGTSVTQFTDLGTSNTSGSVMVSLIDPTPLKKTWSWNPQWNLVNQIISNGSVAWFQSINSLVSIGDFGVVLVSTDGRNWFSLTTNLPPSQYLKLASPNYIIAGNYTSTDAQNWKLNTTLQTFNAITFLNNKFIGTNGSGTIYTSNDLITWTTVISNYAINPPHMTYGNNIYLTLTNGSLYSSSDLITWTPILDSNIVTYTQTDYLKEVTFFNGLFYTYPGPNINTNYRYFISTDCVTWFGKTLPGLPGSFGTFVTNGSTTAISIDYFESSSKYSSDGGLTWSQCTGGMSAVWGGYTPNSNYFVLGDGYSFYVSLDGKYIVPSNNDIVNKKPLQITWADTLGLFVAVAPYSIMVSSDGTTWTEVLNFGGSDYTYGATVSWSRELGIILAYFENINTNAPWLYVSTDGKKWIKYVLAQTLSSADNSSGVPCKPCWSPQLGIFTTGQAISRDGINWTWSSGPLGMYTCSWSPTLGLFAASNTSASYYSTNGSLWTPIDSKVITSIAWSPELGIFVGVGERYYGHGPFFIYMSTTGKTWQQVYSSKTTRAFGGCITWSSELGIFLVMYINNVGIVTYTSSNDGINWNSFTPINNTNKQISDLVWSPELGQFIVAPWGFQPGMYISSAQQSF